MYQEKIKRMYYRRQYNNNIGKKQFLLTFLFLQSLYRIWLPIHQQGARVCRRGALPPQTAIVALHHSSNALELRQLSDKLNSGGIIVLRVS